MSILLYGLLLTELLGSTDTPSDSSLATLTLGLVGEVISDV